MIEHLMVYLSLVLKIVQLEIFDCGTCEILFHITDYQQNCIVYVSGGLSIYYIRTCCHIILTKSGILSFDVTCVKIFIFDSVGQNI